MDVGNTPSDKGDTVLLLESLVKISEVARGVYGQGGEGNPKLGAVGQLVWGDNLELGRIRLDLVGELVT